MCTDHQGTDDQCALIICVAPAVPPVSVINATCQCPSELPISASQCHLSISVSATYQCCQSVPVSSTYQCASVPPIIARQCCLSVPASATYQCHSV
ncbi:unnamed protein product, partial [Staurois parvus]